MRGTIWTTLIGLMALLAFTQPATAQPSCFSGPTRDTANSWQTYRFVNNCGGGVTVRYRQTYANGSTSGIIPHFTAACRRSNVQGQNSSHYEFLSIEWDAKADSSICLNGQVVAGAAAPVQPPDPDPDPIYLGSPDPNAFSGTDPDPYGMPDPAYLPGPDPLLDPDNFGGVSVDPNPKPGGTLGQGVGKTILNLL